MEVIGAVLMLGYIGVAIWCCVTSLRYGLQGMFVGIVGLLFSAMVPILGLIIALHAREVAKGLWIIQKETDRLGKDLNNESLTRYISQIEGLKKIPNYPAAWNALRAAHNMVKNEEELSIELRKRIKRLLQSKGVSGVY